MVKLNILKCHGSGNDFALIDELDGIYEFSEETRVRIAKAVCDRKGPIGADGILYVVKSETCDGKMRIFNADGTEPEMCGNGLRCVGRYVCEKLNKDKVCIETMKEKYDVEKADSIYEGVNTIEISIESVYFDLNALPLVYENKKELLFERITPLSDKVEFSAVSISNPHLVAILEDIDVNLLSNIGKTANSGISVLPKGVNINFVKVIGQRSIYVKTYERGVGLTASCGTGMVSSSIIYCRKYPENLNSFINVYNDGGMIKCRVDVDSKGKYSVRMRGNATYVYSAAFELNEEGIREFKKTGEFAKETACYENFAAYTKEMIKGYMLHKI